MFDAFEIKILRAAGWLWIKLIATLALGTFCGCVQSAPASVRMLEPASAGFTFEAQLKPIPETQEPPPAAPVDRPSEPVPQPTVGTDPGAATLPVVLVYGPPHCAPCARAIRELNETDRYDAHKAAITPALQKIANEWNQGGFPIVTFTDNKGLERFVAPYRGVRDFDQRYNRTMKERAATGSQDAVPPNVAAPFTWTYSQPVQSKKQQRRQARGPGLFQRMFGGEG